MNVLIVVNAMSLGGSEIFTFNLAQKLIKRGHKVIVISSGGKLVNRLPAINVRHHWVATGQISEWLTGLRHVKEATMFDRFLAFALTPFMIFLIPYSIAVMFSVIKREQINIINCMQPGASQLSTIASNSFKIPFVVTVHSPRQIEFMEVGLAIGDKAKKIIAISEETKKFMIRKFNIADNKLCVFPPIVGLEYSPPQQNLKQSSVSQKQVIFISGFFHAGVAISLIEAMPTIIAKISNIKFTIIGQGSPVVESLKSKKAAILNKEFGSQLVQLLGFVSDTSTINGYLDSADLVVGTGLSAWGAIARGKPLVIAGVEGFDGILTVENCSDLISHNLSGRYSGKRTTAENIAESIITLFENENLITQANSLCAAIFKKYGSDYVELLESYSH